ncbi:hypothetical protein [Streptomyces canus]|uniref:hypothetical protein n=1 Tax=Streptomyces canus TaxID=58343 RepID=UPI00278051ED|nr:hypothetical protein [Streptomyces canus]MDQ1065910.1 hypothetical protein [Streptomyces canus]
MTSTAAPATVVVDGGYELAEGGRWFDGRYVYFDLLSGRLFALRDDTGPTRLACLDVPLGAVAPVYGHRTPGSPPREPASRCSPPTAPWTGWTDPRTAPRSPAA